MCSGLLVCTMAVVVATGWARDTVVQSTTSPEQISSGSRSTDQVSSKYGQTQFRAMVPTDLFGIRKYGSKAVSPDGTMIAVEIRGWVAGAWKEPGGPIGMNQRSELWVLWRNGGKRVRLTPKNPVRVSQWNPVWSPNGQKLAFLSNEGEGNAFMEVWDRATGRVRRLTTLGVDLEAFIGQTFTRADQNQIFWLDDAHLIAVLLPEGTRSPDFDVLSRNAAIVTNGIDTAAGGVKPTAIVASSPPHPENADALRGARIMILDTKKGAAREIGQIPRGNSLVWPHYIVVSPNRDWAAIAVMLEPSRIYPELQMSFRQQVWPKLGIVPLRRELGAGLRWVDGVQPVILPGGMEMTIRWKSAGGTFTAVAQEPGPGKPLYLAAVEVPSGKSRTLAMMDAHRLGSDEQMEIANIAWLKDGRVVARVSNTWWAVSGENATRLTSEEEASLKDGTLSSPRDAVKLETSETERLYETDSAGHETTIFSDLNPQLTEIESPRSMNIAYKSAGGETLYANLLLPYGYVQGKRYPTVVWVYAGDMHPENDTSSLVKKDNNGAVNLLLLGGQGYAVLIPSMPLTPSSGLPGDPMLHLNDGVDPAIDRAVELGIVDPDRLAVMGHSYGGYSVFGLLTLTHRYHAGIALMGLSDLPMWYTQFDPVFRYTDTTLAATSGPWWTEWAAGRMGVPLWVDPERYFRNSPVFASEKITTPLLIFSGDLDDLASQSEPMFTLLNRQGKRAEYVRYLGEGHVPSSPANIIDMWQRIFTWLDTYVKNAD
jgi:dipeptidyl aminopeptidase/acylaminoacyl peptidase